MTSSSQHPNNDDLRFGGAGMTTTYMPMSYSRLSTYENCPRKFEHQYILKNVVDHGGEASLYGNRVHQELENYANALLDGDEEVVAGVKALADESKKWLHLVDQLFAQPGKKFVEHQMAVSKDGRILDWDDPGVWARGIADILVVDKQRAFLLDWKTGKRRNDTTQLRLGAALVHKHFPKVRSVRIAYLWLASDDMTSDVFSAEVCGHIWESFQPRIQYVHDAVEVGVFPTRPNPLCPWCPARVICPDARKR